MVKLIKDQLEFEGESTGDIDFKDMRSQVLFDTTHLVTQSDLFNSTQI